MILDTNKLENKLVFDAVQIEKSSNDRRWFGFCCMENGGGGGGAIGGGGGGYQSH